MEVTKSFSTYSANACQMCFCCSSLNTRIITSVV